MPSRLIKDPVRYKTVLCEKWAKTGDCPYGHKCQFAHGSDDLRERVEKRHKEKQAKRGRTSADMDEAGPSQPITASAVPVGRAPPTSTPSSPPPSSRAPALALLPPGLGLCEGARKVVTWAPSEAAPAAPPPSPSTPPRSQPPSPPTPTLAENESPQMFSVEPPICVGCEPLLCRNDSGVQPAVGINSVTGKIELTRVGRQSSHNSNTVRRQLSLLFHDEPDEIATAPTSSAIWQHDHFGMPPVGLV